MQYQIIIGLEVHLQLKTRSKMFCGCKVQFGALENSLTCPVCLGLPGSLPVINKQAITYALKVALALNCSIQPLIKFDRKNYYYPDLPKNYQISQFDMPIALNGRVSFPAGDAEKTVRIRRVHIEEDAGKLIHEEDVSLVDYNRSGTPLLEIVTEPDIYSPQEAYEYLSELKSILKYLDVSDCDMEKGSLRCDANISLKSPNQERLGVKSELKNMNSFKAVRAALEFEVKRQAEVLDRGDAVVQETRLWDEDSKKTFSMRSKEEASDYRYFPEPDLVPFTISSEKIGLVIRDLPELPQSKRSRFIKDYGFSYEDAYSLTASPEVADFFQCCLQILKQPKQIANWIRGPLSYEMNQRSKSLPELSLRPEHLTELINYVLSGSLSNLNAKAVLSDMLDTNRPASEIVKEKNLLQIEDESQIKSFVKEAVRENKKSVEDFISGKERAMMFLVGQVMKKSRGKADPKKIDQLIREEIKNI